VSRVSTSTSNQANVGGAANGSQASLTVGGSTTIYPVTALATAAFEAQYGAQITNSNGGSGAGMQGVIDGDLDIGAASSLSAVYSAVTYVTANSITGVNLQAVQIGGSGVVMITTSTGTGAAGAPSLATPGFGFLVDGTTFNACTEISQAAALQMYKDGTFYIGNAACAGSQLGSAGILAAPAAGEAGPYQTFSRGDNSGTADTFAGWLGTASTYPLLTSTGEQGNPALLSAVQNCPHTDAGCIGYVDLGYAEGAVAGSACQAGWTTGTPCGVAIPEASTDQTAVGPPATAFDPLVQCAGTVIGTATLATGASNCFVPPTVSTTNLHTFVLNALKLFSNANPYMNNGYTVSYPDANSPSTGLVKVFYYVTNGTPTPIEQDFISFMTNPNAQAYFNNNGYFAWDQYAAA